MAVFFSWFVSKKNHMRIFYERKQTEKQQTFMQNVFDQLQDGVLILQKREPVNGSEGQNRPAERVQPASVQSDES